MFSAYMTSYSLLPFHSEIYGLPLLPGMPAQYGTSRNTPKSFGTVQPFSLPRVMMVLMASTGELILLLSRIKSLRFKPVWLISSIVFLHVIV